MIKTIKNKVYLLFVCVVAAILSLFFGVYALKGSVKVSAATEQTSVFVMENSASIRLDGQDNGLRFKVNMNESVKDKIVNNDNNDLYFIIMPEKYLANVGNDFQLAITRNPDGTVNADASHCIYVKVDDSRIMESAEGGYYARGGITGVKTNNLDLRFVAIACIETKNANGTYSYEYASHSYDTLYPTTSLYQMVNTAILYEKENYYNQIVDNVQYDWYGTAEYPVEITTNGQLAEFNKKVENGQTFEGMVVNIFENVSSETPPSFDGTLSVTLAQQEHVMTSDTLSIDLGAYAGYTVNSITCGGANFGTNTSAVSLASFADKSTHGVKEFIVNVSKDGETLNVVVPVCLVTQMVSTAQELYDLTRTATDTTNNAIFGYYKLAGDINCTAAPYWAGFNNNVSFANDELAGFRGTLDGDGHTLTGFIHANGLFGQVNFGATIKDITFVSTKNTGSATAIIGNASKGATYENVNFVLYNSDGTAYPKNVIFAQGWANVLKNVTVKVYAGADSTSEYAPVGSLFGNWHWTAGTSYADKYENVVVYCASLGAIHYENADTAITSKKGVALLKEVELDNGQEVLMTETTTMSLDLGNYAKGYAIDSITLNGVDCGKNPSTIDLTALADPINHGVQNFVVNIHNDRDVVALKIPVTLVTKEISTVEELRTITKTANYNKSIVGYYKLANDINCTAAPDWAGFSNNNPSGFDWTSTENGFRGTLDGNGYTLTGFAHNQGLFFTIGTGAVIKNITFNSTRFSGTNDRLLGVSSYNATYENVTILMTAGNSSAVPTAHLLFASACKNNTFKDVKIAVYDGSNNLTNVTTVFGSGFENNTFEDVTIYAASVAKLGTDTSSADVTSSEGVTISNVDPSIPTEVTLDKQEFVLNGATTISLDIGAYANKKITSITLDGADCGTNVSAINIGADASKHGEKVIKITAEDSIFETYEISVPVLLVTKEISTLEELRAITKTANYNNASVGYYRLLNDIDCNADGAGFSNDNAAGFNWTSAESGFRGTLDGNGHTLTGMAHNQGLFFVVGKGAVIKNVIFNSVKFSGANDRFFAISSYNATYENVKILMEAGEGSAVPTGHLLFAEACQNNTFKDVILAVYDGNNNLANVTTVFGKKFTGNTFENVKIYAASVAKLGTDSSSVDVTSAAGVTVSNVDPFAPTKLALDKQEFVLNGATTIALNIGEYASKKITSITLDGADCGTDVSAINIGDDASNHGEKVIKIYAQDSIFEKYEITVPVLLITKEIATVQDLRAVTTTANSDKAAVGYYRLANDIDCTGSPDWAGFSNGNAAGFDWSSANSGFRATLDGNGYTLTGFAHNQGLFFTIGTGAVIKNITFNSTRFSGTNDRLFGIASYNATYENVTITMTGDNVPTGHLLFANACQNNTFKDVVLIVKDSSGNLANLTTVFGAGFDNNTFENVEIYAASVAKLGTNNASVDVTSMTGVSIYTTLPTQSVLMDEQTIDLSQSEGTIALDLGAYADYTVTDIALNGASYGADVNAINVSAIKADTTQHGKNTFTVKATKGFYSYEITVPVCFATKLIDSYDDFSALTASGWTSGDVVNGYYVLANDIDMTAQAYPYSVSSSSSYNSNLAAWGAYANLTTLGFRGTLDGAGYTVKGSSASGFLLGYVGGGAVIKDIIFNDVSYPAETWKGFLGYTMVDATMENVTFNLLDGTSSDATANWIGWIFAASTKNSTFKNVTFNTGDYTVGSLFGGNNNEWSGKPNTFVGCKVIGTVAAVAANGDPVATVAATAGLEQVAGQVATYSDLSKKFVTSIDEVSVGDFKQNGAIIKSIKCDFTGDDELYAGGGFDRTAFNGVKAGTECNFTITAEKSGNTFDYQLSVLFVDGLISTVADLRKIQYNHYDSTNHTGTNIIDGYYVLVNDIDLGGIRYSGGTGNSWNPVLGFVGTFDGQGHTIYNFGAGANGIFGSIGNGAVIKDVNFEKVTLLDEQNAAILANLICDAQINNVYVQLDAINVTSNTQGAGILGSSCETYTKFNNVTVDAEGLNIIYFAGYNSREEYCPTYKNVVVTAKSIYAYAAIWLNDSSDTEKIDSTQVRGLDYIEDGLTFITSTVNSDYRVVSTYDVGAYNVGLLHEGLSESLSSTQMIERVMTDDVDSMSNQTVLVGNFAQAEALGVSIPNGCDYVVKSVNDDVIILANSEKAYQTAITKFLQKAAGRTTYSIDLTVYNNMVNFAGINISGKVYFDNVQNSYTISKDGVTEDFVTQHKMNFSSEYDFVAINGTFTHTSFKLLPKATYQSAHSGWYSEDGKQLCYTAHGNASEFSAMVDTAVEQLIYWFDRSQMNVAVIGMEDGKTICTCSACTANLNRYGADSASVIKFINAVSDKLQAHYTPYGRDVSVYFIAYFKLLVAPTQYVNEVKLSENAGVIYAANRTIADRPLNDPSNLIKAGDSRTYYTALEQWTAVTRNISYWLYETNFMMYMYPLANWQTLIDNYQLLANFNEQYGINTYYFFSQGQNKPTTHRNYTAFSALKLFITSRVTADPFGGYASSEAYLNALLDEFFNDYYGAGGSYMRTLYNEILAHVQTLRTNYNTTALIDYDDDSVAEGVNGFTCDNRLANGDYWSEDLLDKWIGYCNSALAALNTSDANYEAYKKHILAESVFPRFAKVQIYGYWTLSSAADGGVIKDSWYLSSGYESLAKALYTDMVYCGMSHYTEFEAISSLTKWQ